MRIKEVVLLAAELLGIELSEEDFKEELLQGEAATLLQCYHLIENEVALDYFPLKRTDVLGVKEGKTAYTEFPCAPVAVCSVRDKETGAKVRYTVGYDGLRFREPVKSVEIEYTYAPEKRGIGDETAFGENISPRLLAFGIASEYCLIAHRYADGKMWGERYRDALRAAGILRRALSVRSRRWV